MSLLTLWYCLRDFLLFIFHAPTRWLSDSWRVFNINLLITSRLCYCLCRILVVSLHRLREREGNSWGADPQWLGDVSMQVLGGSDHGCPAFNLKKDICKGTHHQSPP